LGVNGYIWIAKHVETAKDVGINRLEETVSREIYSSQNEVIAAETRREIARVAGCVRALVEAGKRVDEEIIVRAYDASLELDEDEMEMEGDFISGERGKTIVQAVLSSS
jgi:exosome complex component RRP4